MKKLVLVSMLIAGVGATGMANAAIIDAPTERKLVKICDALKSGSRLKVQRVIKQSRLGYRQVAKGLVCDGQDAINYAIAHGSVKSANMLARKGNVDIDALLAKN